MIYAPDFIKKAEPSQLAKVLEEGKDIDQEDIRLILARALRLIYELQRSQRPVR
jgi:hypothetical protein